jgi:hypothetical protein
MNYVLPPNQGLQQTKPAGFNAEPLQIEGLRTSC